MNGVNHQQTLRECLVCSRQLTAVSNVSQQHLLLAVEAPTRPIDTASDVEGGKQTPSYVSLSDKYAIVDAAGTQMLLEEGRWYTCNRLQVHVAALSLLHSCLCSA